MYFLPNLEHCGAVGWWNSLEWLRSPSSTRQNGKTTEKKAGNIWTLWLGWGEVVSRKPLVYLHIQNARNIASRVSRTSCQRLLLWVYINTHEKL